MHRPGQERIGLSSHVAVALAQTAARQGSRGFFSYVMYGYARCLSLVCLSVSKEKIRVFMLGIVFINSAVRTHQIIINKSVYVISITTIVFHQFLLLVMY